MINLKKGSSISLEKDGKNLEQVYIGLNWGKIKRWLGLSEEDVDLDGSVTEFNEAKHEVDTVYFNKKVSNDGAIKHSGDDRGGDSSNDDKDNEVIFIDLKKVNPAVTTLVVYLNSYKGQDFDTIPYANVRLMDGDLPNYKNVIATFNLASDPKYKGKVSVVMAKIVRTSRGWNFVAIGDPVDAKRIDDTIVEIKNHFL